MKKEIIVNVGEHETRIAVTEDDKLVELHVERADSERMVGDMYKGRVTGIVQGMQAAFVDIGMEKAAFLHISDISLESDSAARYDIDAEEEEVNAEVTRATSTRASKRSSRSARNWSCRSSKSRSAPRGRA